MNRLEELTKKREAFRTRLFLLMIQIAFIFAVPAFGGLILGRILDGRYETGNQWTIILLLCAFILSWMVVIMLYRKTSRNLKEISKAIEEEKRKQKI